MFLLLLAIALPIEPYEPYSWNELHSYTEKKPINFVTLVKDYYYNFPCEDCRKNFKKEVNRLEKILPLDYIQTKNEAKVWAWLVHNSVNIRLKKPWFPLEFIPLDYY